MAGGDRKLQLETNAAKLLRSLLLEVTDDPDTIRDTVEGETNLREAIQAVLIDMQEDQILIDGLESTLLKLGERLGRLALRQEKRKEAIFKAMQLGEVEKLTFPEATISLRKTQRSLIVEDEAKIPAQYWVAQDPKLNKRLLKETLDSGKTVAGASLSNGGVTVSIRRS